MQFLQFRYVVSVAGLLLAATAQAPAGVVPIFSVTPGSISAGDQSLLDVQLSLSPDSGYFNAGFTGGTVSFFSGDGGSTSFDIGSGGTTRDFSVSFAYPNAGSYTPSFQVTANYSQQYQQYVYLYTTSYQVFGGYGSYSCGFLSTCYYPIYYTQYQPVYGWQTYTDFLSSTLNGSAPLDVTDGAAFSINAVAVVTPVPAALPLFATGLGALGLLARRRRKKQATA
jgi:hypothetical protein